MCTSLEPMNIQYLHSKRDFADVIKLMTLRFRDYSELSWGGPNVLLATKPRTRTARRTEWKREAEEIPTGMAV